jgi:hypothetical protein
MERRQPRSISVAEVVRGVTKSLAAEAARCRRAACGPRGEPPVPGASHRSQGEPPGPRASHPGSSNICQSTDLNPETGTLVGTYLTLTPVRFRNSSRSGWLIRCRRIFWTNGSKNSITIKSQMSTSENELNSIWTRGTGRVLSETSGLRKWCRRIFCISTASSTSYTPGW